MMKNILNINKIYLKTYLKFYVEREVLYFH